MKKCLLDLDGVLVDLVKGCCDIYHQLDPYDADPNYHDFDFTKKLAYDMRISQSEFWNNLGFDFWANLEWMPDGKEILAVLESKFGKENICIMSSPCLTPGCMDGKLAWIEKHIPDYSRRYLFGPAKWFAASKENLLIDDRDENVDKFEESGGFSLLVPRQWNSLNYIISRYRDGWTIAKDIGQLINFAGFADPRS